MTFDELTKDNPSGGESHVEVPMGTTGKPHPKDCACKDCKKGPGKGAMSFDDLTKYNHNHDQKGEFSAGGGPGGGKGKGAGDGGGDASDKELDHVMGKLSAADAATKVANKENTPGAHRTAAKAHRTAASAWMRLGSSDDEEGANDSLVQVSYHQGAAKALSTTPKAYTAPTTKPSPGDFEGKAVEASRKAYAINTPEAHMAAQRAHQTAARWLQDDGDFDEEAAGEKRKGEEHRGAAQALRTAAKKPA